MYGQQPTSRRWHRCTYAYRRTTSAYIYIYIYMWPLKRAAYSTLTILCCCCCKRAISARVLVHAAPEAASQCVQQVCVQEDRGHLQQRASGKRYGVHRTDLIIIPADTRGCRVDSVCHHALPLSDPIKSNSINLGFMKKKMKSRITQADN